MKGILKMKKYLYTLLSLLFVATISSCEKGDLLNIITQDIDLNENSKEYQQYLKERIESYLKTYRFEEAKKLVPKLTEEEAQKRFWVLYNKYHQEALTQGCGYILASGDTLFLKVMNKDEIAPSQLKALTSFYDYVELKGTNQETTLWGLGNYPALETLSFPSCFVSKVKDLDKLKQLRVFSLTADKEKYEWWFTSKAFKPIDMAGYDLSKNDKLDSLLFDGVDISNLKVTPNTMRLLSLKHGIYTNASLNNIHARHIDIENSDAADDELIINNKAIQRLSIETNADNNKPFKLINVANSSLHKLYVVETSMEQRTLKKVILNENIDTLTIGGYISRGDVPQQSVELVGLSRLNRLKRLSYNPDFSPIATKDLPKNIEELYIGGSGNVPYKDGDSFDYSHLSKLKIYSNGKFISANMKLSTAIDSIYLFPSQVFGDLKALDFSGLKFTKADIYIGSLTRNDVELPMLKRFVFPATLRQLKLSYAQSEVVDLSRCTHLKSLYVFESGAGERAIKKLILPKNLKKSDFKRQHKSEFENDYAFKLSDISNETVIENLPSWVENDGNGTYSVPND